MNDLFLERSMPELRRDLLRGDLCFRDLADAVERQISDCEAATLAWVCHDLDRLRRDAARLDASQTREGQRGIEGLPVGVKDIFNTREFPTQMGSPIWRGFTPGNNARAVDTLLFAGALVAGKTVTAEFAVHALNETRNPHDATRTPGTSSSGSAAAVARGMVPFALGTQTAGSIVRPASFCGIWGMKPSFGLIPRTGVLKTTDSLDTIGFVAAHGDSLRLILDQVRVKGPNYPFVYRTVDAQGTCPKLDMRTPWRVGFVRTHVWEGAEPYAQAAVEELATRIGRESGFELEEIAWPERLSATHDVHYTIYTKSLAYYFQREAQVSAQISPIMRDMMAEGEAISKERFLSALQDQVAISAEIDRLLAPYDFVISLGTSSDAPVRGEEELPDPSLIWTTAHVPSVAAPAFRSPAGLPFGVQFIGRRWQDYRVLQGVEALLECGLLPRGSMRVEKCAV